MDPLATVLTLTYNNFDHIYATIDSILLQTYGNIEILISDDGSDNFPELEIRRYIEENKSSNISNVIILANKRNVGTVKHCNNALRHANGVVYIPSAQDDEFFDKDVVMKIMTRFQIKPFNVLFTSRYGVNKRGEFQRFWPYIKARKIIEKWTQKDMFCAFSESRYLDFASGSIMNLSSDFFWKVGAYDERYKYWEDGPFIYKILLEGYSVDTAYDIVSIRYEQTEGVSNNIVAKKLLKDDVDLFLRTDALKGINDFGYFHRRMMKLNSLKRRNKNTINKYVLDLLFLDLLPKRIKYYLEKKRIKN